MTDAKRRQLLFLALAAVAGWSAWLATSDPSSDSGADIELAEPMQRTRTQTRVAATASQIPAADTATQPAPERLGLSQVNLFPVQTWYVPPPPPPPPPYVPPPPPEAPPLPYSYMGRWQEGGVTTVYLTRGTLPLSVRAGQVLDGVWRLDALANGSLNFTYLPLNQTRSLRTGE